MTTRANTGTRPARPHGKNVIPFTTGKVIPEASVDRITREMRELETRCNLQNRLRWLHMGGDRTGWTFRLYVVENRDVLLADVMDELKPIVSVRHRLIGGINKFFPTVGQVLIKKYGTQATTTTATAKARRVA